MEAALWGQDSEGEMFLSVEIKRQGTEMSSLSTVAVLPRVST